MILKSICQLLGLTFSGAYCIIRSNVTGSYNVFISNGDKYSHLECYNLLFFSYIEYWRNMPINIPHHIKYKFSIRPIIVYHNGAEIHRDFS